jgi:hypothetical protein
MQPLHTKGDHMATPSREGTAEPTRTGRIARTKGVSLLPGEYSDVATVEELTGVGFSEVYRKYFASQMKAAADLLRNAQTAGIALDRTTLRDTWDIHMTPEDIRSLYASESELSLGD